MLSVLLVVWEPFQTQEALCCRTLCCQEKPGNICLTASITPWSWTSHRAPATLPLVPSTFPSKTAVPHLPLSKGSWLHSPSQVQFSPTQCKCCLYQQHEANLPCISLSSYQGHAELGESRLCVWTKICISSSGLIQQTHWHSFILCMWCTQRVQQTSFDLSDSEDLLKNIPYLEQPLARAITGHGGPLGFRLLLKTSGCVIFLSFLSMLEKSYCSLVTCSFISEKSYWRL